jgi:hypothetical protein
MIFLCFSILVFGQVIAKTHLISQAQGHASAFFVCSSLLIPENRCVL